MNPILVFAAFVILLGILLYYLQSKNVAHAIKPQVKNESKEEKKVVKVSDYQTQYLRKKTEEKEEPEIEKVEETIVDDIAELVGIGPKYKELLRAAGYTCIKSIAESNPEKLYAKLLGTNNETGIAKRPPTLSIIEEWVKAASSH